MSVRTKRGLFDNVYAAIERQWDEPSGMMDWQGLETVIRTTIQEFSDRRIAVLIIDEAMAAFTRRGNQINHVVVINTDRLTTSQRQAAWEICQTLPCARLGSGEEEIDTRWCLYRRKGSSLYGYVTDIQFLHSSLLQAGVLNNLTITY